MSSDREQLLQQLGDEVRANQRATDLVDELMCELMGINRTDSRCLDHLEHRGRMTAGELARASGLTTGAITGVIDRLERAGYARRIADAADRRRVLIEPTAKATEIAMELFAPMIADVRPLMERYSDEQLELLIEFNRLGQERQARHAEWLRSRLLRDREAG
jgi:DNA-binding MarR family transcriptional regulator